MSRRASTSGSAAEGKTDRVKIPELPSIFRLPNAQSELYEEYLSLQEEARDADDAAGRKARSAEIVGILMQENLKLVAQKASQTFPVMITRRLDDLLGAPRYEVVSFSLSRGEAIGEPRHLSADPALGDLCPGDEAIVGANGVIIDIDTNGAAGGVARAGENGIIRQVNDAGEEYPYEVEIESEGPGEGRRLKVMVWGRLELEPPLQVNDRVAVQGSIIWSRLPARREEGRFKTAFREDLHRDQHLFGAAQLQAHDLIVSAVARYFNPGAFPPRAKTRSNGSQVYALVGEPGVGKTHTISVACSTINRLFNGSSHDVTFHTIEGGGGSIPSALVGSGSKTIMTFFEELRASARRERGFAVGYIPEVDSLARGRRENAAQLDGGSSLQISSTLLTQLSSGLPENIILLLDGNLPELWDTALKQRVSCFLTIPRLDEATFVSMFTRAYDPDLYEEDDPTKIEAEITAALSVVIGSARVGAASLPVTVSHIVSGSGRTFDTVMRSCAAWLDLSSYRAWEGKYDSPLRRLSGRILHYGLVKRAHEIWSNMGEEEMRRAVVPGLVPTEKASALSGCRALSWDEVAPHLDDVRQFLESDILALAEVLG